MDELLKEVALTIHYLTTATGAHLETCTCSLCTRRDALEKAFQNVVVDRDKYVSNAPVLPSWRR